MCGFVEESVSLGVDFELQEIKLDPESPFLLSADSDVGLLVPSPTPCLPVQHLASHHDNKLNLNLQASSNSRLSFIRIAKVMVSLWQ